MSTLPLLLQAPHVRPAPLENGLLGVADQRAERPHGRTLGLACTPGLSLPLPLPQLVWLRAIYGVPISSYDDPGYEVDLRPIADAIMDAHDPVYNAP